MCFGVSSGMQVDFRISSLEILFTGNCSDAPFLDLVRFSDGALNI